MIPVFWFIGLSGSGKSTLAEKAKEFLEKNKDLYPDVDRWELLDGDIIRTFLSDEIGYTMEERRKSVRVVGLLAKYLTKNGIGVVAANISPFHDLRLFFRKNIPNYNEIYCKCSISECISRDPKGNYSKHFKTASKNYVGLDIPFQEPESPDLILDTGSATIDDCLKSVFKYISKQKKGTL
jgi:adenylylsulfate kinase